METVLEPSQSGRALVRASRHWNNTGIVVVAGATYQFEASGTWVDRVIPTDANGYDSNRGSWLSRFTHTATQRFRRLPDERWFALIGCVNQDLAHAFLIGKGPTVWSNRGAAGTLFAFANDLPCAYHNNRGQLQLTVIRLS